MRDYQTKVAWRKKWDTAPACGAAAPGGLHEGDKPEPRPSGAYAMLACKPDGRANVKTSGSGAGTSSEIDYRRATLTVYGTSEKAVATAMAAIDGVFADRQATFPGNRLDFGADATWMRTEPVAEMPDRIERAEVVNSVQWWKGTLEYRVWTSR